MPPADSVTPYLIAVLQYDRCAHVRSIALKTNWANGADRMLARIPEE